MSRRNNVRFWHLADISLANLGCPPFDPKRTFPFGDSVLFLEVDEMNGSLANGYCRVLSSPKDCVLGGFTEWDCSLLLMLKKTPITTSRATTAAAVRAMDGALS
jgi:hypothetical protein